MGRSSDDAVEALMRAYRAYVLANPGRYALMPLDPLHRDGMAEAGSGTPRRLHRGDARLRARRRPPPPTRSGGCGPPSTASDLEIGGGFGLPEDIETTYDQVIDMILRSLR